MYEEKLATLQDFVSIESFLEEDVNLRFAVYFAIAINVVFLAAGQVPSKDYESEYNVPCQMTPSYYLGLGVASLDPESILQEMGRNGVIDTELEAALLTAKNARASVRSKVGVTQIKYAAIRGDRMAQFLLGNVYWDGINGVSKDQQQSVFWLNRSAKQGEGGAMIAMSTAYFLGIGVPVDFEAAYFWALVAQANGVDEHPEIEALFDVDFAELLEEFGSYLSVEQMFKEEDKARNWLPTAERDPCISAH